MFRRQFIQRITLAGAGGLTATGAAEAGQGKTVTYRIKGFTCIACAVGLETMLRQQKGIRRAEASYPKASVLIAFDPALIDEKSLKDYIAEMGFGVDDSAR
jgi:copper chaperone CopZ